MKKRSYQKLNEQDKRKQIAKIQIGILQIFVLIYKITLWQTIWGAVGKNIRLGFRKGCMIPK